jgi:cation:H+ antiporter
MAEILYFILFASGLAMVVKGSDWFVDSAVWAAEVFHIPTLIIGATIISICTTIPETFVSAAAALHGEPTMAVGNALGSIGTNTGFILAVLLITTKPFIENRSEFLKSGFFLAFLLLLLWVAGFFYGEISKPMGAGLIALLLLYIVNNVISARKLMDLDIHYEIVDDQDILDRELENSFMPEGTLYDEEENDFDVSSQTIARKIIFFCLGIFLVIFGSNLLVENGIHIAELLNVPHFMIAVIFTSMGTSLPELITMIASVRKGASGLGIGNILGANILNIVQVIGISALLLPLPVSNEKSILFFQLPLLFVMVLSVICFGLFSKVRLGKWGGVWLLILYLIFLSANIFRGSLPFLGPLVF